MTDTPIRVGFIGAGANTRKHHIPKLKAQPGVESRIQRSAASASTAEFHQTSQKAHHEAPSARSAPSWLARSRGACARVKPAQTAATQLESARTAM